MGFCRFGQSCKFEHVDSGTFGGNPGNQAQQGRRNNARGRGGDAGMNYEWFDGSSSNTQGSGFRPQQWGRGRFPNSGAQRGQPPRSGNQRQGDRDISKPSYHGVTPPKPVLDIGWKRGLPPDDFRFKSICPTLDDIIVDEYPDPSENIIHTAYDSTNQYLETHFHLLRADCTIPVRTAIRAYRDGAVEDNDMMVYTNVRPMSLLFATIGLVHRMSFVVDGRRVNWRQSKRLIPGTIVCLSTDQFETFRFATVVERDMDCLTNPRDLQIGIRFLQPDSRVDFDRDIKYIMIEATQGYYEAYQHVLRCLQNIDPYELPFQPQLIGLEHDLRQPLYSQGVGQLQDKDRIAASVQEFPSILKGSGEIHRDAVQPSVVDAVERLLTTELAVLQGPPGTGKTFLGLLAAHTLINRCSPGIIHPIVVICQTNHALDQFLEGIMTFESKVVRIGSRSKSTIVSPNTLYNIRMKYKDNPEEARMDGVQSNPPIRFFKMKDQLESEMLTLLEELTEEYIPLDKFLENKIISQEQYNSFSQDDWVMSPDQDEVTTARSWLQDAPDIPDPSRLAIFDDANLQDDIIPEIDEDELEDRVDEFMAGNIDERKISGQSVHLKRSIVCNLDSAIVGDVKEYLTSSNVHDIPGAKRMGVYRVWLQKFQTIVSHKLGQLQKTYDIVCENIRHQNRHNDLQILKRARVVGMTTTAASKYHDMLCLLQPKVIICEEASETLEAHLLAALTPSVEHFILIGDHEQLRPSMSVHDLKVKNIDVSLFERLVMNDFPYSMLDVQRRMRPEIRSLVNPIYPNLHDHESVRKYDNVRGMVHNLWFLTHDEPDMLGPNQSHINQHEVGVATKLAVYLLQQGYACSEITILTMYSGQRTLIQDKLRQSHLRAARDIRVSTVDGFQGEENEIIILSLVRSNANNNIGFLRTSNRVCVGLSRAKKGLYILGNAGLLMEQSDLWNTIIHSLMPDRSEFRIGNRIQLRCQTHPDEVSEVALEAEFDAVEQGGCSRPCGGTFDGCGHPCPFPCHTSEHIFMNCNHECGQTLSCGKHVCARTCSDQCRPCEYCTSDG
ncbi:helicase required for RNAi-mediated heterochromatin assembly 1 [Entomortierella parvispora]|uniref:Helicase required for RNAi-mediated heterochromatin assembly 1 n=1 Tax=Entomortierella parvispora TaxID=205924 RepID=A0A9P3LVN9_9FUNG|nr:helicase required for RNAi-mediated heterochromatin assembly 1 [Entomortierella parvispora]